MTVTLLVVIGLLLQVPSGGSVYLANHFGLDGAFDGVVAVVCMIRSIARCAPCSSESFLLNALLKSTMPTTISPRIGATSASSIDRRAALVGGKGDWTAGASCDESHQLRQRRPTATGTEHAVSSGC